ncbi:MAG: VOC family protein [Bryobacteraceae bacterium]|nr:VOC family protein [Bryobacteraceae bacterium]
MILGLRTVQLHVKPHNLAAVRDWYARSLGVAPYFDEPFYVGFNLGGYEFGLVPNDSAPYTSGSTYVYWGVADLQAAVTNFLQFGARDLTGIEEVGGGIRKTTIQDPFGHRFSLIENPHFQGA